MSISLLNHAGEIMVHQPFKADAEPCLKVSAPYRDRLVVAVARFFTGQWPADLGACQGLPFVIGHALNMKTCHGGQAHNDHIDEQNIEVFLRGDLLPQA
jgi:hypothetical protein